MYRKRSVPGNFGRSFFLDGDDNDVISLCASGRQNQEREFAVSRYQTQFWFFSRHGRQFIGKRQEEVMSKRTFQLLLIVCLVTRGLWAVNDSFVGKWKLDPSQSRFPDEMKVKAAGANRYAFDFGGGNPEMIVADGTDQPGNSGTTLSVTVEGRETWKVVRKKGGRTLLTATWELSKDSKTLSDFYRQNQPDGSVLSMDYVYKRTMAGSGFVATWDSVSERMNSPYELEVEPYQGDGLSFVIPAEKRTRNVRFDGEDYPNTGPDVSPTAMSSGRRLNERALEIIDKYKGKVSDILQIELSPDLKTLTMTARDPSGRRRSDVFVFDRE